MRFEIRFHTPFRVASGHAADGADITVDRAMRLPASSLKGVMKSAGRDLLDLPAAWIRAAYGDEKHWRSSPWSWSDATAPTRVGSADTTRPAAIAVRARIQIDPLTSTAVGGALTIGEEVVAHRAEFTIERVGWIPPRLRDAHQAVLIACARAVTAVGGDRRRGLGWVTIAPIDPEWPTEPDALAGRVDALVATLADLPDPDDVEADS